MRNQDIASDIVALARKVQPTVTIQGGVLTVRQNGGLPVQVDLNQRVVIQEQVARSR